MTSMSKFAIIAAVAAVIASPAFAQSTSQNAKVVVHQTSQSKAAAARQSGLDSFAMVPGGAYDPALSGGGSVGYNQNLRTDQW
jgi:opacity protein-like surface antigen